LVVIITDCVANFMADSAAIPCLMFELHELVASGNAARRGKSAAETGIFLHCHEIRRRSSCKFIEMYFCRCGPLRDGVTKLLHFGSGDGAVRNLCWIESIRDRSERPLECCSRWRVRHG